MEGGTTYWKASTLPSLSERMDMGLAIRGIRTIQQPNGRFRRFGRFTIRDIDIFVLYLNQLIIHRQKVCNHRCLVYFKTPYILLNMLFFINLNVYCFVITTSCRLALGAATTLYVTGYYFNIGTFMAAMMYVESHPSGSNQVYHRKQYGQCLFHINGITNIMPKCFIYRVWFFWYYLRQALACNFCATFIISALGGRDKSRPYG